MKKYLIALDLDGTLLYDWETLKSETVEYIKSLRKEGHRFVIATGRPYRSSKLYHKMLELDTPIINYNGGLVTWHDNPDFEPIKITLEKNAVLDIFEKNQAHIQNAFCEIGDDIYLLREDEEIMPLIHYFGNAKLKIGPFSETLPEGPNGFIIVANEHKGQYIESYVRRHYKQQILSRNWGSEYRFIIELYTPKTNKGEALKHVAKTLGFQRDQVLAFGDGHNDIEMLDYAHVGVAMKNAHPELLKVADQISAYKNTEYAIERFLKDFLK